MIELRHTQRDLSVFSYVQPTKDLTASEKRRLQERRDLIDTVKNFLKRKDREVWARINHGMFKGSIFRMPLGINVDGWSVNLQINRLDNRYYRIHDYARGKAPRRGWEMFVEVVALQILNGIDTPPIQFQDGMIFPDGLNSDVRNGISVLLDYEGGEEFHVDHAKRPLEFKDRLGQDVKAGDLVVVALNYGAGLDVCMVRGYADETRVLIQSVESGQYDRIALTNNATNKIMRMPNSLRDTAMMIKLARD